MPSSFNMKLTVLCFMFWWSSILPKDLFRVASYKHELGSLRFDKGRTLFTREAEPLKGFVHMFSQRIIPPTEPAPTSHQKKTSPQADPNSATNTSFPHMFFPNNPHSV